VSREVACNQLLQSFAVSYSHAAWMVTKGYATHMEFTRTSTNDPGMFKTPRSRMETRPIDQGAQTGTRVSRPSPYL